VDGVQTSMAALYDLHTALIDAVAQHPEFSGLLDDFKQNREIIRKEWERNLTFLQESQGYTEDYLSLCRFALDEPVSDCLTFARNILQVARKVTDHALRAQSRHGNLYEKFQKQQHALAPLLPGTHRSSISPTHGALRLSGRDALVQCDAALREIGTSLGDMAAFWKHHVGYMDTITSERAKPFSTAMEELKQSTDTWRLFNPMFSQAVMSISLAYDAAGVNAQGTPYSSKTLSELESPAAQEVPQNDQCELSFLIQVPNLDIYHHIGSNCGREHNDLLKFPDSRTHSCAENVSLNTEKPNCPILLGHKFSMLVLL